MIVEQALIADIKAIIQITKETAIRAVDHERTLMYWRVGQRIFEEEQVGKDRAEYGQFLTQLIAAQLEPEFGNGFSKRQIELFRQFYCQFPIANALYSQLSWSQYKLLLRLDTPDKRDFYIGRNSQRQLDSSSAWKTD